MQSLNTGDGAYDLAEAERRVSETLASIQCQRQLIEELKRDGHDLTSARIVLDSLLVSLALCLQDRHRRHIMLNAKGAEAVAP